jgi:hypothetical protein
LFSMVKCQMKLWKKALKLITWWLCQWLRRWLRWRWMDMFKVTIAFEDFGFEENWNWIYKIPKNQGQD